MAAKVLERKGKKQERFKNLKHTICMITETETASVFSAIKLLAEFVFKTDNMYNNGGGCNIYLSFITYQAAWF